jgi:hypothetical protein
MWSPSSARRQRSRTGPDLTGWRLRRLPDGTDPDALAVTLLATLQGTLLLAQVQWDACLLETAVDTLLQLARNSRPRSSAGSGAPVP